jgi:hypothetical protein
MKTSCLLIPALCLLAHSPASAAVVIDNLTLGSQSSSQSISGPTATGFFGPTSFANREVAFSFTTASTSVYLTEIAFYVSLAKSILDPVRLTLSTGSTVPGGTNALILGEVAPATTTPTSQLLALAPSSQVQLAANTLYWMHVTVPVGAAVYSFQSTNSQIIEPGWALGNTWFQSPLSSWTEVTSGPQARIRLTVEPVPEASSALLGGCGVLLLLCRRR